MDMKLQQANKKYGTILMHHHCLLPRYGIWNCNGSKSKAVKKSRHG